MMGTEKRQILVVDDVELNRAILAELFQDSYEVLEAENGCQALELLEAHHDDIRIIKLIAYNILAVNYESKLP